MKIEFWDFRNPLRSFLGILSIVATVSACDSVATAPGNDPDQGQPEIPDTTSVFMWSEPQTWLPANPPTENGSLIIPAGKTIVLDVSPPALGRIQINGTLLAHPDRDVHLQAREIHIRGALLVGSASRPHNSRFDLTLTGAESPDLEPTGAKALAVFPGGKLELHGRRTVSWTYLSSTAQVGATSIQVSDNVDWSVGDRIVVASTDFEANHAEDFEIVSVNGQTIGLDRPMRWSHWGEIQNIEGHLVDQRAEVGLLTRNIRVQSDSFANRGFGGHLIVLPRGSMQLDGVEFYRMGQKGRLARYAVHWHMLGNAEGQYVRNSAIWRTNNRCLTIHGTDNAVASGNVCYDHLGHGYFLEDGAETGNRIEGNLGLVSRVPAADVRLLASDANPATFWITNPDNHVEGNSAAGSVGFGFWYAFPAAPTGLSSGQPDRPRYTPLGVFRNNVAHSNHRPGLNVDDGPRPDGVTEVTSYHPREGAVSSGAVRQAVFEGFSGWKHRGRAIWLRGSSQIVKGAILSDNMIGATFANNTSQIERSVVIGETRNVTSVPNGSFPIRGFEFYDGTVSSSFVEFINFVARPGRPASAYGYNRKNGWPTSSLNFSEGVKFVNSNGVYLEPPDEGKDGDKSGVIGDRDGSLTGRAGTTVVPDVPILRTADCSARPEWNSWQCPHSYGTLRIQAEAGQYIAPMEIERDDGVGMKIVGIPSGPVQASMSLIMGKNYNVVRAPVPGSKVRYTLQNVSAGTWVRVTVPFSGNNLAVFRDYSSTALRRASSRADFEASEGTSWYRDGSEDRISIYLFVRPSRNSTSVQLVSYP